MLGRGVVIGNPVAGAELPEYRHIKLSSIVINQDLGDAKPTEDVFHHEPLNHLLGYCSQGLCFYPFSEVVYCGNGDLT